MDQQQFLKIIDEQQGIIHKICRLYRNTREDREDLFQDIVFQLWKSIEGFGGRSKISTWIYCVALHIAIDGFRKKKPKLVFTESVPERPDSYAASEVAEQRDALMVALQQLEDGEKAIILLYLEDLDYKTMSEILGISENYVGVKLNRIKTKIQQYIQNNK